MTASEPEPAALVPAGTPKPPERARPTPGRQPAGLTPIEKAAIILAAIGPELASGFLRSLSEQELERFARAIGGLGRITQAMLDAAIVEFLELLTTGPEMTGYEAARALLAAVLDDEEEVQRLIHGRRRDTKRSVWQRLNDTPPPSLASFLQSEHPQAVAVILSELKAEVAANVLERLDHGFARSIVLRLSRVPALDPPVSSAMEDAIEHDFLSVLQRKLSKRHPAELIAGLMNNISTEVREGFLAHLEERDAALAQDVQRTMFTFEDIATRVSPRDVAGVLREVPEDVLLPALKLGQMQGSATVVFVLENVPRRLAERYAEDLNTLPAVPRKEGDAAQIEITKAILAQVKAGTIRFLEKEG